jgi:streptogramin lyase
LEDRIVPSPFGSLLEYAIAPTSGVAAAPWDVASGPDGNLWFTESGTGQIGQFNPSSRTFQEYSIPTANSEPRGIASAVDATGELSLDFVEYPGGHFGRITLANGGSVNISESPVLDQKGNPVSGTHLVDLALTSPDLARVTGQQSRGHRVRSLRLTTDQ